MGVEPFVWQNKFCKSFRICLESQSPDLVKEKTFVGGVMKRGIKKFQDIAFLHQERVCEITICKLKWEICFFLTTVAVFYFWF